VAGPPGAGFGRRKAPSSMAKISAAEVLRLRATSAVSAINRLGAPLRMTILCENQREIAGRSTALCSA
jgi:hypothetical protein